MPFTVSRTISDDTLNRIIQIESAGKPKARPRLKSGALASSAYGLGQFLNATWLGTIKDHNPAWAKGSKGEILELRANPSYSIEMLARHTEDNARIIKSIRGGDLYLAHFAGAGSAQKIVAADPDTLVVKVVGQKVIDANPHLRGQSCGWTREWAASVMAKKTPKENWIVKYYRENETAPIPKARPKADIPERGERVEESEIDFDEPKPHEDITPHGETTPKIYALQENLDSMGYHEVGTIDGVWGGGTKGALAAFLNDRGIDGPVDMRESNLIEVENARAEHFTRPINKQRAEAKPADLAPKNETILQSMRGRMAAFWGMIVTAFFSAVSFIGDQFSDYWDKLAFVRKMFAHVPGYLWAALVISGLFAFWYVSRRAVIDTTKKYNERKLLQ